MSLGPFCSMCGEDQYCRTLHGFWVRSRNFMVEDICTKCLFTIEHLDDLAEMTNRKDMMKKLSEIFLNEANNE